MVINGGNYLNYCLLTEFMNALQYQENGKQ